LKSADTLPESFTDGAAPRRPAQTGSGRSSMLPQTSRPARNTSPPTRRTRSLATIASLLGIRLSFKRWNTQPGGLRKWILTISRNDFARGSIPSIHCKILMIYIAGRKSGFEPSGNKCLTHFFSIVLRDYRVVSRPSTLVNHNEFTC
jgi:hypothetical protein